MGKFAKLTGLWENDKGDLRGTVKQGFADIELLEFVIEELKAGKEYTIFAFANKDRTGKQPHFNLCLAPKRDYAQPDNTGQAKETKPATKPSDWTGYKTDEPADDLPF